MVTAQEHPLGRFVGSYVVSNSTIPAPDAEIVYRSVAGGRGLQATWRHGEGETSYEAQALWGYEPDSGLVTVLEVNTVGVVAVHVGSFGESGVLTLERFDEDGTTVLERRVFTWADADRLDMTLDFFGGSEPVHHRVRIVRD